jgi:hypothetical protein
VHICRGDNNQLEYRINITYIVNKIFYNLGMCVLELDPLNQQLHCPFFKLCDYVTIDNYHREIEEFKKDKDPYQGFHKKWIKNRIYNDAIVGLKYNMGSKTKVLKNLYIIFIRFVAMSNYLIYDLAREITLLSIIIEIQ